MCPTEYSTTDSLDQIVTIGVNARAACKGEYESLKAIFNVCPGFAPAPHGWGKCEEDGSEAYFLLEEFVQIGAQVSDSILHFGYEHVSHAQNVSPQIQLVSRDNLQHST